MTTRTLKTRYSTAAIILHWLIAALLIFEVALGLRMEDAAGATKFAAFQLHKSIGITILLLVAIRLAWRFMRRPPSITASGWERLLAQAVHLLFYLLLFALPLSGWMIVSTSKIVVPTLLYGAIPWPDLPFLAGISATAQKAWHDAASFIHVNLVTILYGLFALHIAGALKHHLLDRDGDMARMVPGIATGKAHDPRLIAIGVAALLAAGLGLWWYPLGARSSAKTVEAVTPKPENNGTTASLVTSDPAALAEADQAALEKAAAEKAEAEKASEAEVTDLKAMPLSTWKITPGSTLRFSSSYEGDAVNGSFAKFGGDISFSPDHLGQSHVEININMASASTGDSQRDGTLKSADFFSVASFANATFKANRFSKSGKGYIASGTLRMKGMTVPITVPFTLDINGDKAMMRGSASLNRSAFKIGEGEFASTSEIPAQVKINIQVNAVRSK